MAPRFPLRALLAGALAALPAAAQKTPVPAVDLSRLPVRRLGPAVMGGRVVGLAVREDRPTTFYVATASGGLWKTVNNGTTFTALFQHERVVSIGAIAIAATDPDRIWVGTGEANNRNSSSWGGGVWSSRDGGKTWTYRGLGRTLHIGRIAVHPKDPDIVFVAALGGLWGPNPERGLYRSRDGGKTWKLVLRKDARTGATDVRIDPEKPDTVYCALYERQRDGFDGNHPAKRWGPGSGIYKSTDGGDTWRRLTRGLPTVQMGRIALEIYRKDPSHVYALIETEKIGTRPEGAPPPELAEPPSASGWIGITGSDAGFGVKVAALTENGPSKKAGLAKGDIILAFDGRATTTFDELLAAKTDSKPGKKVAVEVLRGRRRVDVDVTLGTHPRAAMARFSRRGRGARGGFQGELGGQRENAVRQQGPNGFQTGGIYRSTDHGETWKRINSLAPRPYYFAVLRVDPSDERYIYVPGVAFYMSTDGGKRFQRRSLSGVHVDHHAMWIDPRDGRHILLGCDGGVNMTNDRCKSWEVFENLDIGQAYHAVADTRRPYWVYAGYQDNGSWGSPSETHFVEGTMNTDCFKVGGGDGFVCRVDPENPNVVFSESQGGNIGWQNVMTGERGRVSRGRRGPAQRGSTQRGSTQRGRSRRGAFNWNTPFLLSRFNSRTIYFAGDRVYKSVDRGRHTTAISDKITGDRPPNASATPSATALAESPRRQGVLWVGTDDGKVLFTQDDGRSWTDRSQAVHALLPNARPMWISSICASSHVEGRAYLAVDGHRSNDREPYVFVTDDFGAKWKRLAGGLPEGCGSVHVVLEDTKNEDLLYLGTETGLWISVDRGKAWQRLPEPFPTVAVRDFDLQEREQHLIIATHGRSVWVLDVRPLRDLTAAHRKEDFRLVPPNDVLRLARRSRSKQGHRHFAIPNPPERASFYYWLGKDAPGEVHVVVRDVLGKEVWRSKGKTAAGLHRADWNLRRAGGRRGVRRALRRFARFGRGRRGVPAGTYAVTLEVGKKHAVATFRVDDSKQPLDVSWPRPAAVGEGGSYVEEEEGAAGGEAAGEGRDR